VLDEPFHLSYPCVFKTDGQIWMIPESWESGSVRLYRSVLFPTEWVFVKTLLNGQYVDTTPVHHEDRWWLFTTPRTVPRNTTLCLFSSEGLSGDWIEHPSSPIISGDANLARPAGRLLDLDGRLIRIAQDDDPTYGNGVRAFQVTQLTQSGYEEQEIPGSPHLTGSGRGWNRSGMHHADWIQIRPGKWIAAVDGRRTRIAFGSEY